MCWNELQSFFPNYSYFVKAYCCRATMLDFNRWLIWTAWKMLVCILIPHLFGICTVKVICCCIIALRFANLSSASSISFAYEILIFYWNCRVFTFAGAFFFSLLFPLLNTFHSVSSINSFLSLKLRAAVHFK